MPDEQRHYRGERLEQVDRIVRRSSTPEAPLTWQSELPLVLLEAELLSIAAAALARDSFRVAPLHGLLIGFGLAFFMFGGAHLYRTLRAADVPLFRGKGFFLRAVLGPLLLPIAWGALLSPLHRWLRNRVPLLSSAPVVAGTAAVCLSIVASLHATHDPLRRLVPILREARASAPVSDRHVEAGDVWEGRLRGAEVAELLSLGLSLGALGGTDLWLEIGSIDGQRLDGSVRLPGERIHVSGLFDGNVLALVGDRALEGRPSGQWPLAVPVTAAIDASGELRSLGRGPQFALSLAAPP
jgi:hypothetical protein